MKRDARSELSIQSSFAYLYVICNRSVKYASKPKSDGYFSSLRRLNIAQNFVVVTNLRVWLTERLILLMAAW